MEIDTIINKFKSEIEVFFKNGKKFKIHGEWTTTPAFYAESFQNWEKPFRNEVIDDKLKERIMKKISEFSKTGNPPTPVYFD